METGIMVRQCLNRSIDSMEKLADEVVAWQADRNRLDAGVDWQFTTHDARIRPKRLYPSLHMMTGNHIPYFFDSHMSKIAFNMPSFNLFPIVRACSRASSSGELPVSVRYYGLVYAYAFEAPASS